MPRSEYEDESPEKEEKNPSFYERAKAGVDKIRNRLNGNQGLKDRADSAYARALAAGVEANDHNREGAIGGALTKQWGIEATQEYSKAIEAKNKYLNVLSNDDKDMVERYKVEADIRNLESIRRKFGGTKNYDMENPKYEEAVSSAYAIEKPLYHMSTQEEADAAIAGLKDFAEKYAVFNPEDADRVKQEIENRYIPMVDELLKLRLVDSGKDPRSAPAEDKRIRIENFLKDFTLHKTKPGTVGFDETAAGGTAGMRQARSGGRRERKY